MIYIYIFYRLHLITVAAVDASLTQLTRDFKNKQLIQAHGLHCESQKSRDSDIIYFRFIWISKKSLQNLVIIIATIDWFMQLFSYHLISIELQSSSKNTNTNE